MEKEQLREAVSIKTFLETEYGCVFRRIGSSYFCLSPLRAESNPSFSVNFNENLWYDFGTGEGGDIFKLVMKLKSCGFKEALEYLRDFAKLSEPAKKTEKILVKNNLDKSQFARKFYQSITKTSNELFIRRYFKDLSLPFHSEIGVAEYRDSYGNRFIAFPIPDRDNIEGLECRAVIDRDGRIEHAVDKDGHKIRRTIGRKACWFLKRTSSLLITESIIDCLAGELIYGTHLSLCALNGVGNARLVPEIVHRHQISRIYLALDADEPGRMAEQRLIEIIPHEIEIHLLKSHINAGVKDLYRLLKIKNKKEERNVSRIN